VVLGSLTCSCTAESRVAMTSSRRRASRINQYKRFLCTVRCSAWIFGASQRTRNTSEVSRAISRARTTYHVIYTYIYIYLFRKGLWPVA
jgi:hypothetical protein